MTELEIAELAEDCLQRIDRIPGTTKDVLQFKRLVLENLLAALEEYGQLTRTCDVESHG